MAYRYPRQPYRKQVDREVQTPQVLIARGELNIEDKALLTRLLGRFGLSAEYMSQADYDERERKMAANIVLAPTVTDDKEHFRFANITSPDHFLVREHFKDFQDRVTAGDASETLRVSKGFVGRLFNFIVDGNGTRRSGEWAKSGASLTQLWVLREPNPLDGIVLAKRTDVGFPPYELPVEYRSINAVCAPYAVQAGSIVEAAANLPATQSGKVPDRIQNLHLVARLLEQQFN